MEFLSEHFGHLFPEDFFPTEEELAEAFTHYDTGTMMADIALFSMAVLPIIIGSIRSVKSVKDMQEEAAKTGEKVEVMSSKDATTFPIYASFTLLSLYVLIKMIGPEYATMLLTAYITLMGVGAVTIAYAPIFSIVVSTKGTYCLRLTQSLPKAPTGADETKGSEGEKKTSKGKKGKKGKKNTSEEAEEEPSASDEESEETEEFALEFTNAHLLSFIYSIAVSFIYLTTKHWVANNLVGLGFAVAGVQFFTLNEFKIGVILLSILFFYDIFWVFYTDVMVTVAKNFDAPIKVTFPRDFPDAGFGSTQLALLGLGDIVLPGAMLSLLLRYDQSRRAGSFLYFGVTLVFYMLGLLVTGFIMHFFKHAQPALLYLVPACLFAPLFLALVTGELGQIFRYRDFPEHLSQTADERAKDEKEKKEKEKEEAAQQKGKKKKN